ncbi:MAG: DUF5343 domain-containing protein [Candidatus Pacearchaeota archaeon]|nr:DUF5343 domain-containing protein [Candidatus Pacearchaeota archaeon]
MALPNAYLITTKNIDSFFNSIVSAQAPDRFSYKFLTNLDFKSTNDRLFVGVLKTLNFIDESGVPTQRYYNFLDQSESKLILATAIEEAYSDLFELKKDAQNLTNEEVKNKMRTLTQGQKSDKVLSLMANTFKGLCDYADWTKNKGAKKEKNELPIPEIKKEKNELPILETNSDKKISPSLNYNIQIHLPETRDVAVYDSIFKSLKEHLLK